MRHRSSSAPISGMLTNHPHSDILTRSGHLNRSYPTPAGMASAIRSGPKMV